MRQCLRQAAEAGDLDVLSAFPIIVKGQRNVHEPLPFSLYKDLKRSIREDGLRLKGLSVNGLTLMGYFKPSRTAIEWPLVTGLLWPGQS